MGKRIIRWLVDFIRPPRQARIDVSRRAIVFAGLGGLGAGLLFRSHPLASGRSFNPAVIRPPGSLEEKDFLARCIRCGECMKVCPTNAIQPTLFEAGFEGLWSPILNMKLGYCEYECTLCGQVCPTDAIQELDLESKKQTRIGLAFFDKGRCLPYAFAKPCIVCEEHCPTPKKAIWFQDVIVVNSSGEEVAVKQPHVDADLCNGCGICENKCPVRDEPAVRVTSVGESRNPDNQILLSDSFFLE